MTAKFSIAVCRTALILTFVLGGCAGGGSQSLVPSSTVSGNGTMASTTAAVATNASTIAGTISGITSSSEFLLKSVQCGYEYVYYNSSTSITYNGQQVAAGTYASVTFSGKCGPSVTATSITLGTPTTIAGTISGITSSSEFLLKSAQCGYEYVYYNSSTSITYNGQQIAAGTYASVTFSGKCGPSVTATSITLGTTTSSTPTPMTSSTPPVTTAPSHVPTWTFDEYGGQGQNATAAQVQMYVTYAEGGQGNNKAASDCGVSSSCSSVFYMSPNLIDDCNSPFVAAASEDWYIHEAGYTDAAHRVNSTSPQPCNGAASYPVYAANGDNPAVQSFFRNYLQTYADAWNYYFMDDTEATVVDQFYGPSGGMCGGFCYSTEELTNNAAVVAEHESFAAEMRHTNGTPMKFFYNSLTFDGATTPNNVNVLSSSGQFVGAVCENCVVDNGVFRPSMYGDALNAMAEINAIPGAQFVELNNGYSAAGSSSQVTQRLVTIAVAWLGFSPGHTVVWENLEDNNSNLAVWPEEQLYPMQPLESMATGASDIAVGSGVYRREFAACFDNGVSIGQCAAIVNATSTAVTVQPSWLKQSYGHVIQLAGGDTLSGGSLSLASNAFTINSTSVQAGQGILLVK
jgi:hypothetical protein